MYLWVIHLSASAQCPYASPSMTMCIAACLFLFRTGSLSVNSLVGSSTPTTGSACGNTATAALTRSKPAIVKRFMGTILRQPTGWCQVLNEAKNQLLTRVGPGTPMGGLLRRYWMPIAAVSEFDRVSIKPVRLMGEDLTLYKDLGGTFGLV